MIIANPIYDVVFKYLLEDVEIARELLSTILGEEIVSLELKPQETTTENRVHFKNMFPHILHLYLRVSAGATKKFIDFCSKSSYSIMQLFHFLTGDLDDRV